MAARAKSGRQLGTVGRRRSSGVSIPNPWEAAAKSAHERASIIRSTRELREEILLLDPWLPIPQNSCCYAFGEEGRSLPVGALLYLWDRWAECTGPCPECGGAGFGYSFGGLLNVGGVHGCCTTCERVLHRQVGGLGTIADRVEPILRPTPYFLKTSCYGGTYKGPRGPLVMALRCLGATDLPDAAWIAGEDPAGVSVEVGTGEKRVKLSMEFSEERKVIGSRGHQVM